jgi:CheY-like chemotaxis protein
MGFEPITTSNGKEAVERAIMEKPDLILMDFDEAATKWLLHHLTNQSIPL